MTVLGDGWTPGKATILLASWLDAKLGVARPPWPLHAGDGEKDGFPTPNKRGFGKEYKWWLRQWTAFDKGGRSADDNTLPRRRDDFAILPEVDQLKPLVFGGDRDGRLREKVAREVARSAATDHLEVCEHLGRVFSSDRVITLLPRFSRLADVGMAAMNLIAKSLQNKICVELTDIAASPEAAPICEELWVAAQEWLKDTHYAGSPHRNGPPLRQGAIPSARPIESPTGAARCIERGWAVACAGSSFATAVLSRARPGEAVRGATASACGPSAALARNVASSATCREHCSGTTRRKRTEISGATNEWRHDFGWQSLLHTDAPSECSLKAALFTTYDRADECLLVEHLLPLFLKLGREPNGEGAERQYFLLELDRRLKQLHDHLVVVSSTAREEPSDTVEGESGTYGWIWPSIRHLTVGSRGKAVATREVVAAALGSSRRGRISNTSNS